MSSPVGLVDEIKLYRNVTGCSLEEAKRVVEKIYLLLQSIDECATFYELRQLVRAIAERTL
jgi:hypothetical protein